MVSSSIKAHQIASSGIKWQQVALIKWHQVGSSCFELLTKLLHLNFSNDQIQLNYFTCSTTLYELIHLHYFTWTTSLTLPWLNYLTRNTLSYILKISLLELLYSHYPTFITLFLFYTLEIIHFSLLVSSEFPKTKTLIG